MKLREVATVERNTEDVWPVSGALLEFKLGEQQHRIVRCIQGVDEYVGGKDEAGMTEGEFAIT